MRLKYHVTEQLAGKGCCCTSTQVKGQVPITLYTRCKKSLSCVVATMFEKPIPTISLWPRRFGDKGPPRKSVAVFHGMTTLEGAQRQIRAVLKIPVTAIVSVHNVYIHYDAEGRLDASEPQHELEDLEAR